MLSGMESPLLETKFHLPRPRRGLVARSRLIDRLDRGAESTLTLVSAPAGFGKTTLLADWLAGAGGQRPAGWLTLDQQDNEPALFWTYLLTALSTVAPGVGRSAMPLLQSGRPSMDSVLAILLNDLSALTSDVLLVLDDYHVIESREIQERVAFLIDHLPQTAHLVIAGRADPPLPLARLRASGQLTEVRAAELRFTPDEAAAYLNEVMGLGLTTADVATLDGRTEGWIAALQLAALSMQDRDDAAGFIAGFAGDDQYIVDYLVEEVLQRQAEPVRQFLLQTAILDRLTGSLCEAVTGQQGGQATLRALERANLFLVALDDRRQWYRYHQLFADVLHAHLVSERPDGIADLHRRASHWFSGQHDQPEAIRHAVAGRDFQRAADLVELALPEMRRTRREAVVRAWSDQLPDEVIRVRPALVVGFAGARLAGGELDGVEARLQEADRLLAARPLVHGQSIGQSAATPSGIVVLDEQEFHRLPAMIELYRAALALARGDLTGTVRHAGRALDLAPQQEYLAQASAAGLLGLAQWAGGDLEAGHTAYSACMAGLFRAGHVADTFGCAIALADIRLAQGRPRDAMLTYEQALQRADQRGGVPLRGASDMYVGMSTILRERGDLPSATALLLRSQELGEHAGLPQNGYRTLVAMAQIREVEADPDSALDLLMQAERAYVSDFFPNVRPVPAMIARLRVAAGQFAAALGWVRERGLSLDDDLGYLSEFEHITLARVLLARDRAEPAGSAGSAVLAFLERIRQAADAGGRAGAVIETDVLLAVCHQTRGDLPAALAALDSALTLAEPEGYLRIFLDEGPPDGRAADRRGETRQCRRVCQQAPGPGRPT